MRDVSASVIVMYSTSRSIIIFFLSSLASS